ncbi:hypothetical protein P154DRAFT_345974 [Amniculicola lignicola CBS 123094]|uniref:Uncharacterized protein n=1 Tax=Amniculicola lignicola CBS 123094 TaxID=1392246 RepID=A0A6A5W2Z4_9PLEO|nr:hypothetical protein P154DRAFT_345974 [Amniculicola lignicola CBS 123094]
MNCWRERQELGATQSRYNHSPLLYHTSSSARSDEDTRTHYCQDCPVTYQVLEASTRAAKRHRELELALASASRPPTLLSGTAMEDTSSVSRSREQRIPWYTSSRRSVRHSSAHTVNDSNHARPLCTDHLSRSTQRPSLQIVRGIVQGRLEVLWYDPGCSYGLQLFRSLSVLVLRMHMGLPIHQ